MVEIAEIGWKMQVVGLSFTALAIGYVGWLVYRFRIGEFDEIDRPAMILALVLIVFNLFHLYNPVKFHYCASYSNLVVLGIGVALFAQFFRYNILGLGLFPASHDHYLNVFVCLVLMVVVAMVINRHLFSLADCLYLLLAAQLMLGTWQIFTIKNIPKEDRRSTLLSADIEWIMVGAISTFCVYPGMMLVKAPMILILAMVNASAAVFVSVISFKKAHPSVEDTPENNPLRKRKQLEILKECDLTDRQITLALLLLDSELGYDQIAKDLNVKREVIYVRSHRIYIKFAVENRDAFIDLFRDFEEDFGMGKFDL